MGKSLEVFAPSLVKYVGDTSGTHADKILCEVTGVHKFDSVPVITSEMWKAVQDFNMLRIRLAYVEHIQAFRFEWMRAADYFTNEGKGVESEDDGVSLLGRSSRWSSTCYRSNQSRGNHHALRTPYHHSHQEEGA
jgi:hypothetical protein